MVTQKYIIGISGLVPQWQIGTRGAYFWILRSNSAASGKKKASTLYRVINTSTGRLVHTFAIGYSCNLEITFGSGSNEHYGRNK
jgi:hypothetical protein